MPKKIKWVYVIVSEKKQLLMLLQTNKKKIIKRKKKVKKSDLTINHDSKSAQLALGYS